MQNDIIYYNIGGRVIRVSAPPFRENAHLSAFRCEPAHADAEFSIFFADAISPPGSAVIFGDGYPSYYADGSRTMQDQVGGGILFKDTVNGSRHSVEFLHERAEAFGNMMMLHILDISAAAVANGGLILHASYIEHNGSAILFTANKQVGKSTQAALWEKHRNATVVNGDRALIIRSEGGFSACGSPYCGTSDICLNKNLPLRAIVILSQAPANSVRPATAREAVCALLGGANYNTADVGQIINITDTVNNIISTVPVFCLACTPDERAVEALEAVL